MKLTKEIFQSIGEDYYFANEGLVQLEGIDRQRRQFGWSRSLTEQEATEIGWFPYCGDELLRSKREPNHIIFCPGSFNPIHEGHMSMPRELIKKLNESNGSEDTNYHIVYLPAAWEYSSKKSFQIFSNDAERNIKNNLRMGAIAQELWSHEWSNQIATETYWNFSGAAPVDLNFLTIIRMFMDSIKRRRADQYYCIVGADNQLHLLGLKYLPDHIYPVLSERSDLEIDQRVKDLDDLLVISNPFPTISSTKIRKEHLEWLEKMKLKHSYSDTRCIAIAKDPK